MLLTEEHISLKKNLNVNFKQTHQPDYKYLIKMLFHNNSLSRYNHAILEHPLILILAVT